MKDIIGLRAHIAERLREARENEAAAQIVLDEAVEKRQRWEENAKIVDEYRGVSEDGRRNSTRFYEAPSAGSKGAEVEAAILDVLGDCEMTSEEIFQALVERDQDGLFPGDTQKAKMGRLSNSLTKMHRRENPAVYYNRDKRVFGRAKGE